MSCEWKQYNCLPRDLMLTISDCGKIPTARGSRQVVRHQPSRQGFKNCGHSSEVERLPSKQHTRVRFPLPALILRCQVTRDTWHLMLI